MRATAAAFVRDQVKPEVAGWERSGAYPRKTVAGSGLTPSSRSSTEAQW